MVTTPTNCSPARDRAPISPNWPRPQRDLAIALHEVTVYVGLGSNEGDREATLRTAIERLDATPGIAVLRVSGHVESRLVAKMLLPKSS